MSKIKILVLGGGISGLTIAHMLAKQRDRFEVELIEESHRLGGWLDTDTSTGFFFEKGPRVFRGSRSSDFLALIEEIGLKQEIVESDPRGKSRYVWINGKLRKAPILSWDLVKGLVKDWRSSPLEKEDESVWDFACRHFNPTVAAQLFDPLVVGICGGCSKEISVKSILPLYKDLEKTHGSLLKGMLKREKFKGPGLFGLLRGTKSVVQRLVERTPIPFHLNESVLSMKPTQEGWEVRTSKKVYKPDFVFSALPSQTIGKLLVPELLQLPLRGTTLVNLGYSKNVLRKKGFGYLVPPKEKEEVLGVIFDSNAFPHYNHLREETRLTVMLKLRQSESEARSLALKAVAKHLEITTSPDVSLVMQAPHVFPQFLVGHEARMRALEESVQKRYPRLRLSGNYLYGSAVNNCIARAKAVVEDFLIQDSIGNWLTK